MVVAVWLRPLVFFFFFFSVPKNHRVHRRANYRIAIARTHNSSACAHLTAASRQMIQNTGGNWFSVEVEWEARGVGRATEQRQRYN